SVRQAEHLAARLANLRPAGKQKGVRGISAAPELAALAETLSERLGTKVTVKPKSKTGGIIEIHYRNLDDLDRILDILDAGNSPGPDRNV
ncbi:hypothetical protein FJY63_08870, partial [Candidatus Sumerlaeota bacterium]|nr:hypothetical protein [Candidatus Sumerlaeota bacterium]